MELTPYLFWNIFITLVLAPILYGIRRNEAEAKRIDILLNKTREEIAKEGQHPRAYEVVGQLIGQVATSVDKLQDLQKKLKDLKELPGKTNANIKNALFVGSTAELQKMLNKQSMETKKEKRIENETIDGKSESKE